MRGFGRIFVVGLLLVAGVWLPGEFRPESLCAQETTDHRLGELRVGKVLFLGNSITLHGPAPDIGWTGNWGMAASSREKDFVHLLVQRITAETKREPEFKVRNIADFERNLTDFAIKETLKEELAFQADLIILAIGENSGSPKTDAERARFAAALRDLLTELKQHGAPTIFVRSEFWPDAEKDKLLKEACSDAGGVFVDLSSLGGDPTYAASSERQFDHAGVAGHPGDKGMQAIADLIWKAMLQHSGADNNSPDSGS